MLLTLALALAPTAFQEPGPTLPRRDLPAWRAHLRPTERDLAYARVPWEPTFLDGLRAAGAAEKPLLLWLMNGHPLGCT